MFSAASVIKCVLFLCWKADNLEKTEDRGQALNSKMLSAKITVAILYTDCTEVNRINQDYWTGQLEVGSL